MTTVIGDDVDPVLDDDEDEDPFVDVSEAVEAERAKTTLLPRRHAKKGKAVPKLNTSEPDPSWSDSEIELTEGDDEDDEAPLESAKTTLLPRRRANAGQVTGQFSMEDDPDKADESEPPFAVNPVSAAPQFLISLSIPRLSTRLLRALPMLRQPAMGSGPRFRGCRERRRGRPQATSARDSARQPAVGFCGVFGQGAGADRRIAAVDAAGVWSKRPRGRLDCRPHGDDL